MFVVSVLFHVLICVIVYDVVAYGCVCLICLCCVVSFIVLMWFNLLVVYCCDYVLFSALCVVVLLCVVDVFKGTLKSYTRLYRTLLHRKAVEGPLESHNDIRLHMVPKKARTKLHAALSRDT